MKNLILPLIILLAGCAFTVSCNSDSEETPTIRTGEWTMSERTLTTSDPDLDNNYNFLFKKELEENTTTRAFSELNVKTTVRKQGTSGTEGLISEVTETYTIKGDSIYVVSQIYEGTMVSKYIMTNNTLTTHRPITSEDLKKIVPAIGIDPSAVPNGVTGILKIKELR